jgi:GNAT superfamily N-acetyltransferase
MAEREVTVPIRVSVADEWQGKGVGTALVTRLAERAREDGVSRFTATCLASNDEVLDLLRELGPTRVTNVGDGLLEAEIELPASADTEGPLRRLIRRVAAGELAVRVRP